MYFFELELLCSSDALLRSTILYDAVKMYIVNVDSSILKKINYENSQIPIPLQNHDPHNSLGRP